MTVGCTHRGMGSPGVNLAARICPWELGMVLRKEMGVVWDWPQ